MKAYITKDKNGIAQLWNNKPEYNQVMQCWQAWITKGYINEVPIDVTSIDLMRTISFEESPREINL